MTNGIRLLEDLDDETRGIAETWWRSENAHLYGKDVVVEADSRRAYARRVHLVQMINDSVVGVAIGKCSLGLGYLHELIVDPDHRGRGSGSALLRAFETTSLELDCPRLALRTMSEDARSFYEQRGWTVEFISPHWIGNKPCIQMRKFLD